MASKPWYCCELGTCRARRLEQAKDPHRCAKHQPGYLFARKRKALEKLMLKRSIATFEIAQFADREIWSWTTKRGTHGRITLIKPEMET